MTFVMAIVVRGSRMAMESHFFFMLTNFVHGQERCFIFEHDE